MHGNGVDMLEWVGFAALAFVTWRWWVTLRRHRRYTARLQVRYARAREDVVWNLYRRVEYVHALRLAAENGDLAAPIVLFDESLRNASRKYPRLAAALERV